MRLVENLVGLVLVLLAWFNPFAFALPIRIALFVLGFDIISILPKVGVFTLNFLIPGFEEAFGFLSWALLFLFLSELIIAYTESYKPYAICAPTPWRRAARFRCITMKKTAT